MNVFTYGTLMFPEIWRTVVGRSFPAVEGTAAGYAIYQVRDAVFPGIIAASEAQSVRGVVYLNVDAECVERLDRFEDDFYRRVPLTIACDDGERRSADAYVVPAELRSVLTDEAWQADAFVASGGLAEFIGRFAGFGRLEGNV